MSTRANLNLQLNAYNRELLDCCLAIIGPKRAPHIRNWLDCEQQGYPEHMPLPDYRVVRCQLQGLFDSGPNRHPRLEMIYPDNLCPQHRCQLQYMTLRAPLHDYLEQSNVIRQLWPQALVNTYAHELIPGMTCLQAWQLIEQAPVSRMLAGTLQHLQKLLLDYQDDELFYQIDCHLNRLVDSYPAKKPLWQSRPQHIESASLSGINS